MRKGVSEAHPVCQCRHPESGVGCVAFDVVQLTTEAENAAGRIFFYRRKKKAETLGVCLRLVRRASIC